MKKSVKKAAKQSLKFKQTKCSQKKINNELKTYGYFVFRKFFDLAESSIREIKDKCDMMCYNKLFRTSDFRPDENRLIYRCFHTDAVKKIRDKLNAMFVEHLSIPGQIIVSLAGGQEQVAHTDSHYSNAPENTTINTNTVSCVFAVTPNSRLKIWPKSHMLFGRGKKIPRKSISPKYIDLDSGDCVLFIDNFIHAGCGYEEKNYRLHVIMRAISSHNYESSGILFHEFDPEIKSVILDSTK